MTPKRGLNTGRGLEALFPQKKKADSYVKSTIGVPETESGKEKEAPKNKESRKTAEKAASAEPKTPKAAPAGDHPQTETAEFAVTAPFSTVDASDIVRTLRITEIAANVKQPRKAFDEEAIAELAESIKEFGILQPLLVQKKGDKYEIIAGERRYRAAKSVGLQQIPVIVREYTDRETFEISLIENLQRENLNPIEEAQAYQRLIEEFGMTQEAVAGRVSKSRAAVANSLRLLNLEDEIRQMLIDGRLSMGHARALLGLEIGDGRLLAAKQVADKGMSVRDTERLVKRLQNPTAPRAKTRRDDQLDAVYQSIEERLQRRTGTKVAIHRGHGETGRIEIEYYSQADLERIISLIE